MITNSALFLLKVHKIYVKKQETVDFGNVGGERADVSIVKQWIHNVKFIQLQNTISR